MNGRRWYWTPLTGLAVLALLSMVFITLGFAYANGAFTQSAAPTSTHHFTVWVGGGQPDDFPNLQYTPDVLNIYAGDSVTFSVKGRVEPHTVSFGPKKLLDSLAQNFITPVGSKNGPPTLVFTNKVVLPTARHTYDGTGYANSGVLNREYRGTLNQTNWTIKFTKPGEYTYYCLIHYPGMHGTIFVHPRPTTSHFYVVGAGIFGPSSKYNSNVNAEDVYFPGNLTVHVGDTVRWESFFHTVTFGTVKTIQNLRRQFVLRKKGPTGKWVYVLNPAVAFPSDRSGCGTKTPCMYAGGFLNSGLLQGGNKGPATFDVTFTKPGFYYYGCLVHPGMDGTVRVLPTAGRGKAA